MKYVYLIFFYFTLCSKTIGQAKDDNYEQLKEIEKKLSNNQEVYLEILVKIFDVRYQRHFKIFL